LSEKTYIKEIPSDPELLPEAEDYILNIAKEVNLDQEKFNHLTLAFSEAAANSIVHGNKSDKNKIVKITVTVDDEFMTISLKDQGEGFKVEEVPDPTAPENILKDHGRGIHIMKSFLKDLRYVFTPEGTETILVISLK
jgi:serine/threonine-protein kinase RsbW